MYRGATRAEQDETSEATLRTAISMYPVFVNRFLNRKRVQHLRLSDLTKSLILAVIAHQQSIHIDCAPSVSEEYEANRDANVKQASISASSK